MWSFYLLFYCYMMWGDSFVYWLKIAISMQLAENMSLYRSFLTIGRY